MGGPHPRPNEAKNTIKSKTTAILLCLFLGGVGAHRFYLGRTKGGIGQLLTLGGLGFWALSDLIELCRNRLVDNDGNSLV